MVNKNRSGKGWSVTQVAEALMIDRETVRKHYKRYRQGGIASATEVQGGRYRAHAE
jgi:transposase